MEIASAISRRARGQSISAAEAAVALAALRSHLRQDYRAIALDAGVVTRAMALAESRGLRGYDAVQLATALQVMVMAPAQAGAFTFVSSDLTLNAAASGEGLAVVNPESQP